MTRRQRRLTFLLGGLGVLAVAVTLVFVALGDRVLFFYSPTEAKAKGVPVGETINLGGLVAKGSVAHPGGAEVTFKVTDGQQDATVTYSGDLPDLFREGQGVVITGAFRADGVFAADKVLAKHDEKYMPPEVARALKERGLWQEGGKTQ
ncbi:MAG: cytochrome c maturation protein CcmE [Alphaproteobacteria bacterium]|nr:cytochrome c maturation protein CcmE [Alphaproteobacteria bacterium]